MTPRQWLGITTPNWIIWSDAPRSRCGLHPPKLVPRTLPATSAISRAHRPTLPDPPRRDEATLITVARLRQELDDISASKG
jgi:hypothetical protein